jgi:hypothetical protein
MLVGTRHLHEVSKISSSFPILVMPETERHRYAEITILLLSMNAPSGAIVAEDMLCRHIGTVPPSANAILVVRLDLPD